MMGEDDYYDKNDTTEYTSGDLDHRYQTYLFCADDGKGNERMTGLPLKTYDEWLNS